MQGEVPTPYSVEDFPALQEEQELWWQYKSSTVRKAGGLPVAYAQILSMDQFGMLEHLSELQGEILALDARNSEAANLTGFSLAEDEGSLRFD